VYSLNNALGVSGASCIILNRNMPLNSEHPHHSNSDSLVVEEITTKSCWETKRAGKKKNNKRSRRLIDRRKQTLSPTRREDLNFGEHGRFNKRIEQSRRVESCCLGLCLLRNLLPLCQEPLHTEDLT
jgi:hypothetical protein